MLLIAIFEGDRVESMICRSVLSELEAYHFVVEDRVTRLSDLIAATEIDPREGFHDLVTQVRVKSFDRTDIATQFCSLMGMDERQYAFVNKPFSE